VLRPTQPDASVEIYLVEFLKNNIYYLIQFFFNILMSNESFSFNIVPKPEEEEL